MRDRDPQRYYAALNVSPTASVEEIRLSYEFFKQAHQSGQRVAHIGRIQAAYDTLTDPRARACYDRGKKEESGDGLSLTGEQLLAALRSMLGSTITLGVASIVLVGFLALTLTPRFATVVRSFSTGDELVWKESGRPIGRVLAFESGHEFTSGVRADGYRIQPEQGDPVWMPAGDLKRHAKTRN